MPLSARSSVLLALLLSPCLACSSGGGDASPTAPLGVSPAQVELDSYGFVNDARSDNGVEPQLELRDAISRIAREHSEDMRARGALSHEDSMGRRVDDRLAEEGVSFGVAAENLAMVTNSPNPAAWVHDRLMASSEHRPNILDPRFELIGVGVVREGSTYWVTQIFVGQ